MNHILALSTLAIVGIICFAIGQIIGIWGIPLSAVIGFLGGLLISEIYGWSR